MPNEPNVPKAMSQLLNEPMNQIKCAKRAKCAKYAKYAKRAKCAKCAKYAKRAKCAKSFVHLLICH
jgi:hypothetical protein